MAHRFRDDVSRLGSLRISRTIVDKKRPQQRVDLRRLWFGRVDLAQRRSQLPVTLRAGVEVFGPSLAPHAPDFATEHFSLQACDRDVRRDPERVAERGGVGGRLAMGAEGLGAA